jgi:DNA-binding GntR family transcriptional regulator
MEKPSEAVTYASAEQPEYRDAVLHGIREAIMLQRLLPGTKLHEEALAEVFGVSRTRVRAALKDLQHRGLIESSHKRVARVARPSVSDARDMFAARRLVEPWAAAEVAGKGTPAVVAQLQQLIETEHAIRAGGNRLEATRLAGEFHVAMTELAGNTVITRMIREVVDRTLLVIVMYQSPSAAACVHEEHSILVDAIAARDALKASQAMTEHLLSIESRMNLLGPEEPVVDLSQAFEGIVPGIGVPAGRRKR